MHDLQMTDCGYCLSYITFATACSLHLKYTILVLEQNPAE